jgi:hypothetical protein
MGVVITFVTVCVALAKQGVVRQLRRVLPYVGRVAGVLLVIAGAYMTWYGWWEQQVQQGEDVPSGPTAWVTDWSGGVQGWVEDVGSLRLGLVLAALVGIVLVLTWGWRASRPPRVS